jgi:hypothetical protein
VPGKAQLTIKDKSPDTHDQLKWKWAKGAVTGVAEFGDPAGGPTDYTLCVYDRVGGTPKVVSTLVVPHGGNCGGKPCWKANGSNGFTYGDQTLAHAGVKTIRLRAGTAGKAQVQVQAKGTNLGWAGTGSMLPFAQAPAVTVQLTNSAGKCWSVDYSAPARKNGSDLFVDRGD